MNFKEAVKVLVDFAREMDGYSYDDVTEAIGIAADYLGESGEPDDSADGDHASALKSAGFGTDEDYE